MDADAPDNDVASQFDDIVSMILARSRGEVENDDIEHALSSIVAAGGGANGRDQETLVQQKDDSATKQFMELKRGQIIPDEGNYDDDDDDDDTKGMPLSTTTPLTITKKKKVSCKVKDSEKLKVSDPKRDQLIEQIPLGKMGERMLITFGDGPNPHPSVVDAALLGARSCLQRAILDARALRRKLKDQWHQAKAAAAMHSGKSFNANMKKTSDGVMKHADMDSEMYFRAMEGYDRLRFDLPCGFDIAQLQKLFPEEMYAYQRWKNMHKAYTQNSGELKECKDENDDAAIDKVDDVITKQDEPADDKVDTTGRLTQRLANFDARTNQMGDDWYLTFADVRRGSFLPRKVGPASADTKEWQENRKALKTRGRPPGRSSWQNLHPSSVVFLHWIGFDQRSALAPPNEETTQALGFLAYDIFGKIVEKAVSLRLESTANSGVERKLTGSENPILELTAGDQLEKENLEQALVEVNMKSLYSSSDVDLGSSSEVAQLYFGPGFEDRLEIELDEIFGPKHKKMTDEELKVRKEEEKLFSDISRPPTILASMTDVLNDDSSPKDDLKKSSTSRSKKRERDS